MGIRWAGRICLVIALAGVTAPDEAGAADAADALVEHLASAGTPHFGTGDNSAESRFLLELRTGHGGEGESDALVIHAFRAGDFAQVVMSDLATGHCILYAQPGLLLKVSEELPGFVEAITGAHFSVGLKDGRRKTSGSFNVGLASPEAPALVSLAEMSVLHRPIARKLGLGWSKGTSSKISEVGGGQDFEWRTVRSLTVGGLPVISEDGEGSRETQIVSAEVQFAAGRVPPVSGIIGGDVWRRTPFTLDPVAGTLTVHRRRDFRPPPHATAVPLELRSDRPFAAVSVFGEALGPALLDTGAFGFVYLPRPALEPFGDRLEGGYRWLWQGQGLSINFSQHHWCPADGDRIPAWCFGSDLRIPRLAVGLPVEDGDAWPVVAASVMRLFRLTFDYQAGLVHAIPVEPDQSAPDVRRVIRDGRPDLLRQLLEEDPSRALPPAVELAISVGEVACVGALLAAGAEDATASINPLAMAARSDQPEIVDLLLAHGVDPAGDETGRALLSAIQSDRAASAHRLVRAGALLRLESEGESLPALTAALAHGSGSVAHALLDAGAEPEPRDLFWAVNIDSAELMERLIRSFETPPTDVRAHDRITPLHEACGAGRHKVVGVLLEHGWDPDASDDLGRAPLLVACGNGSLPCMELLLQPGADANRADTSGRTPLFAATVAGRLPVVDRLLVRSRDRRFLGATGSVRGYQHYPSSLYPQNLLRAASSLLP